jgi:oligopeptide/dipeptide ABC transporter ATP-binding protein
MELLNIKNLDVNLKLDGGLFKRPAVISAVSDVSLSVKRGESFGIVGESGCGKTTLANAVLGFVKPDRGEIFFKGGDLLAMGKKERDKRRREMQIIFQDPYSSLNPRMPVRSLISEPMRIRGERDKKALYARAAELLELVGLSEKDAERYAPDFSGGQRQRVAIARALCLNPELIVCDEPLSALDVSVHAQICNLLSDLRKQFNFAYLFISHNLAVVRHMTESMAVMYLGKVVEYGDTERIFSNPAHPYTRALIGAIPDINSPAPTASLIKGETAGPINLKERGCRFMSRCVCARSCCADKPHELAQIGPGHFSACRAGKG